MDGSSDIERGTQASNILRTMLNPGDSSWKSSDILRSGKDSDYNLTNINDSTTDSSPSRNSGSLQIVNFHGLGQTQTQLLDEEGDINQGSQKENIGSPGEEEHSGPMQTASNVDVTKAKSIGVKALPHQPPPNKAPTLDNSHGYTSFDTVEYSRPFSPSKQSSNPLAERSHKDISAVPPDAHRSTSPMRSNFHKRRPRHSPSPFEGVVLVAPTPSASGGSQSQQSQRFQEAQFPESLPDLPSSHHSVGPLIDDMEDISGHPIEDYLSDAPSNFYAENNEESLSSTALEATQPCTQVDDVAMDVEPTSVVDSPLAKLFNQTPLSTTSNTTTTDPRSLLSMLSKDKRQRYLHTFPVGIEGTLPRQEYPLPSVPISEHPTSPALAPGPHPQAEFEVETQPSLDEEIFKPPQRRFPARSKPQNTNDPLHRAETGDYKMDVVPDSEPLREMVPKSKPFQTAKTALNSECVVSKEHSSDDDEDDIPLAAHVHLNDKSKRSTAMDLKGKGQLVHGRDPSPQRGSNQERQRSSADRKNAASSVPPPHIPARASNRTRKTPGPVQVNRLAVGAARSSSVGIVPSSVPGEELVQKNARSRAKRTVDAPQPCSKSKGTVSQPPKRTRKHVESSTRESHLSASDDELLMQAGQDEGSGTEPADDLDMDPDFDSASSRKRKRGAAPAYTAKTTVKTFKKAKKAAPATPALRQTKRLRSVASTSLGRTGNVGTRVFALWRQTGFYYTGTVQLDEGDGSYQIFFDDDSIGSVSIDDMRHLDLRVNDDVMIPDFMRGFKVSAVDKLESHGVVSVRTNTGIQEFALENLRLALKTVSATWQDRILERHMIVPIVNPEALKASPAPSSLNIVSARRAGRSHVFEKTAFVVSVSSTDRDWEKQREHLMSKIKNSDGMVVNDWTDVVDMTGTFSENNNRWTIQKHEARWIGAASIERIFLLADVPTLKPKFLTALALGVPCLNVEWLNDTVASGEEKNWLAYTLGQGISAALNTQVSQQVDMNWGHSVHYLKDIMGNKAPCKLFDGKSILCVGDMVPKMKVKKLTIVEEKSHEAHNAATRIILAMGADRVEAVNDIRYASSPLEDFDLVIIKKADSYDPEFMLADKTVHWNWVKDCLIASRLLPQPQWALESQEA